MSEETKVPMSKYTVEIPKEIYFGIRRLLQENEIRDGRKQTMASKLQEYIVNGYKKESHK